jgi:hypothetical protein
VLAVGIGVVASIYVLVSPRIFPSYRPDFDQLWEAARAWRAGDSPYRAVLEIHRERGHPFGLVYPLPAVIVIVPFSFLPRSAARTAFAFVSSVCFAYLVLARWWLFPILLSAAFRSSVSLVQIAPFVACATMAPAFGWVLAVKPNAGIPVGVALRRRRDAIGFLAPALALGLVSLALRPEWPWEWRDSLGTATNLGAPVLRPFGFLLLLAIVRWRQPAARWLVATALLPGTPAIHNTLPLLTLLPTTFREALVFSLLSHVADLGSYWLARGTTGIDALSAASSTALLWGLYIPAVGWLLLRKSNDAAPNERHG